MKSPGGYLSKGLMTDIPLETGSHSTIFTKSTGYLGFFPPVLASGADAEPRLAADAT